MTRISTIQASGQWYLGNTHAHTTISDGILPPDLLVERYRALGYAFTAITDHRVYGIHADLCRPGFLILPGVELDVRIEGPRGLCHHVVGLGRPGLNTLRHGEHISYAAGTSVQQLIDLLTKQGNLCLYAHPGWSHVYPEDLSDITGLAGLEIFNFNCEVELSSGYADTWYNRLLWSGRRLWCLASDDTHLHYPDLGGGFIRVKADALTQEAIIASLMSGSFHASEGPLIDEFAVESGQVLFSCSPCRSIALLTDSYPGQGLSDQAGQLRGGRFTLKGSEHYVRAVCTDLNGKKAWTQPIWLD
jgi:hypothetical protein